MEENDTDHEGKQQCLYRDLMYILLVLLLMSHHAQAMPHTQLLTCSRVSIS